MIHRTIFPLCLLTLLACQSPEGLATSAPPLKDTPPANPPVQLAPPFESPTAIYTDQEQANVTATIGGLVKAQVFDPAATRQERAEKFAALARALPQVHDAGVSPSGSAWVRLQDGTSIAIFDDLAPASLARAPSPAPTPFLRRALTTVAAFIYRILPGASAQSGKRYVFPDNKKAYLSQIDGLAPQASAKLSGYLDQKGYAVTAVTQPSLKSLRETILDYGVFWMSTHGAYFADAPTGREMYGMVTGEPADVACQLAPEECEVTREDIRTGRAYRGVMTSTGHGFFLIGARWIHQYWNFAPGSLLFLDACDSLNPSYANQEFLSELRTAHAGGVFGWYGEVYQPFADHLAALVFDRVLGINDTQPLTPPQRPFSAAEIFQWLADTHGNFDTGPHANAHLDYLQFTPEEQILVPSLRNFIVDENKGKLNVFGEFGIKPGILEISGNPVGFDSWDHDRIVATLPTSGPASKGLVGVKFNDIASNRAPITDWTGTFKGRHIWDGNFGPAGPFFELNCSLLRVRVDAHRFRLKPEGVLTSGYLDENGVGSPSSMISNINKESTCIGTSGGEGIKTEYGMTTKYQLSSTFAAAHWTTHEASGGDDFLITSGGFDTVTRKITLDINSRTAAKVELYSQKIAPAPMGPVITSQFVNTSNAHVGYEMAKRGYAMDESYNLPLTKDSFAINFTAPVIPPGGYPGMPSGVPLPPNLPPLPAAPVNHGEIELKLDADPATIPKADTPA